MPFPVPVCSNVKQNNSWIPKWLWDLHELLYVKSASINGQPTTMAVPELHPPLTQCRQPQFLPEFPCSGLSCLAEYVSEAFSFGWIYLVVVLIIDYRATCKETSFEAISVIQARNGGDLNQSSGSGLFIVFIFKASAIALLKGLDVQ